MTKQQIERKLHQLIKLLDQIDEARVINPDESATWDSDTLDNLSEKCQKIIQLLENKKALTELDEFGDPLILEAGLCSLVDEFKENHD